MQAPFSHVTAQFSLCKIFSTDAGQVSICRKEGIFVVIILFSLQRFTGHLSDRLKVFAGQNEKMPVLSGSPAFFVKTVNSQLIIKFLFLS